MRNKKSVNSRLDFAINKSILSKSKRSQEEIVGFALIIIIVAVILLVILGLSIRGKGGEAVQSYEAGSFLQASLQYTSDCYDGIEYLPVQKLIFECGNDNLCDDGRETCDVLKDDLKGIIEKSWKVSEETPVKGYKIAIVSEEDETPKEILSIEDGDETRNYKTSSQSFSRTGIDYDVSFSVYY